MIFGFVKQFLSWSSSINLILTPEAFPFLLHRKKTMWDVTIRKKKVE